jgi:hypothetical protein
MADKKFCMALNLAVALIALMELTSAHSKPDLSKISLIREIFLQEHIF